ncbi:MAG: hypothetical protein COT73_04085 [Bdellovibrio sp. CG10_big_fil_rev_8_21_14_0_10_47_8]|nr:MAG: hypothetical protein COT73_04085 [Bdellovibrio sp. CG10_big_fil_rev_8_21_14_0_10_47_8]
MISYEVYKILHIAGIALLCLGLGAVAASFASGSPIKPAVKMAGFIGHGLGLLLILIGGFGMAARLGLVHGLPEWIYAKLGIWLVLGGVVAVAKRKSQWIVGLFVLFTALVSCAAWIAITKPF